MKSMTTHERVKRMYERREADRVPFMDYAWTEAVSRWRGEGLPTDDYYGYFDLDKTAYISLDNSPRYPVEVIEETDEYVTQTTPWGATRRNWKKMTSTPENLSFRVDSPDKWLEAKARMTPSDDRIPWDMLKKNYKSHHNPIRTTMHRCIFRRRKAILHIPSVRRPETITVVLAPMCYDGDLWCIEIN